MKMTGKNTHFSILTLNVNSLNEPNKKTQISKLDFKKRSNHMLLTRDSSN
jgi:hypothetical protein